MSNCYLKSFYLICIVVIFCQTISFSFARKIGLSLILQDIREPQILGMERSNMVKQEYIEQRLDNFDPLNKNTWKMRYYRNDEFFKPDGPIFIYVGGEWTIYPDSLQRGHMVDMAAMLGGQLFYTEHRYYGLSLPTRNASVDSLRFLNVEQSLADLAYFITYIKEKQPVYSNSKVVLIGGSFGATMVTWFRQKYPHLIVGAWAAGGPLQAKVDFTEYREAVGKSIRQISNECYDRIRSVIGQSEKLIADRKFKEFSKLYRICEQISDKKPNDIMGLFAMFANLLAAVVEKHKPGIIEGACISMFNATISRVADLQSFALWTSHEIFGSKLQPDDCIDISYENDISFHKDDSWDSSASKISRRQWNFQLCNEFGWYHSSEGKRQPFGRSFPINYYMKRCQDIYGDSFSVRAIETNVKRKNVLYGGLTPDVTNVYFTYGQFDPWRVMGLQNDLNEHSPVDIIPDASHCHELSSTRSDNPKMQKVHERIFGLIKLWMGQNDN